MILVSHWTSQGIGLSISWSVHNQSICLQSISPVMNQLISMHYRVSSSVRESVSQLGSQSSRQSASHSADTDKSVSCHEKVTQSWVNQLVHQLVLSQSATVSSHGSVCHESISGPVSSHRSASHEAVSQSVLSQSASH